MSFKVAETHNEVTKPYLNASLEHQYRGKGYKYSEDLLTILESDYKRKVRNLDWLFKGKTRVRLQPTADRVFKSIKDEQSASDLIALATSFGYEVTAENFVAGYIIIDKQKIRLAKSLEYIFSEKNLSNVSVLPTEIMKRYIKQGIRTTPPNKYKPEVVPTISKNNFFAVGDGYSNSQGLVVNIHRTTDVAMSWSNTGAISIDKIMASMNSTEVVLSIDINDYITCSEGSFSSCMSEKSGSSRHLGWMMHFRSDFSVMTFTHKKGDEFYKTGRSWTFVKLTEDGLPFARPFYKLSRVYGELNQAHVSMVDTYIQESIESTFHLGKPTKHTSRDKTRYGDIRYIASPNMQNTSGSAQGTGYFDWPSDNSSLERLPIWEYKGEYPVVPFDSNNYKRGPICLFNFPDALDINGEPTNEARFNNNPEHHYQAFFGWNERVKQFVTCKASGKRMLLRDTIEIAKGEYLSKDIAISIIAGKPQEVVEAVEEVPEAPAELMSLDGVDVCDF